MANIKNVSGLFNKAYSAGYYLEAISLRLLILDFFLRIYIVTTGGKIRFKPDDKETFGLMIKLAEKGELEMALIKRLNDFNRKRVAGIHRLLLGDIAYDELRKALDDDPNLVQDLEGKIGSILPTWS